MQSIPHPDVICAFASPQRSSGFDHDQLASREDTWCAVRNAADGIEQSERLERLRRLRSLITDAHDVRDSGHVYDLGERLNELELGHNFEADSRYVSRPPMEIAYLHFGRSVHMSFDYGRRWLDGVYIRNVSDSRGDGILFTFIANNISGRRPGAAPTAEQLCEASNCASAFVPADEDPRSILHNRANYRGESMLGSTLRIVTGAEVALYGLSMLSPLRPIAKNWNP